MEIKTLLKAGLKKHMGSLTGIFVLTFLAAAALATVLTVWTNSNRYIRSEIERAGFGEITAWISGAEDTARLAEIWNHFPK